MNATLMKYAAVAAMAATTLLTACKKDGNDSAPTYKSSVTLNGVTWASVNVDDYQTFAARPDMYTKFYQWNRSTAWSATGNVTGWTERSITDTAWTVNPCPEGWRLPAQEEYQALHEAGSSWAKVNARGNAVAGRFYGANHATCELPNNMAGCVFFSASGARDYSSGALLNHGSYGNGWSSTQTSTTNGYDLLFGSSSSYPANVNNKAFGFPIRCVQ